MQMANSTSHTKTKIVFNFEFDIYWIDTMQFASVFRFDVYEGMGKLKKMIIIVFNMQISKNGVFEFIKIEFTNLTLTCFSKL